MQKWLGKQLMFMAMVWVGTFLFNGDAWAQNHQDPGHEKTPVRLGELVVTAQRVRDYAENHPHQVTVMTRVQIERGNYTNLEQVLNAFSGVEVKKSGSGAGARISIRGSGASGKILFLINGRPANSSQYGGIDLDSIPLDMVSRVDVFKPPVPVWLGPGATAGAINIVLANPPQENRKRPKATRIGIRGGSFGKAGLTASRLITAEEHRIRLSASTSHKDGHRTNSDADNGSIGFQWELPSTKTAIYDINGRYYQSEHGAPGPTYNLTPDARQSYQKGALDFRVQNTFCETVESDLKTYLDITRLEDMSQSGAVSTLEAFTVGIKDEILLQKEDNQGQLRITGGLAQDRIDHSWSDDHHREKGSLGLQGDRQFGAATASLGGRWDYFSDFGFQPAADAGLNIAMGPHIRGKINAGYGVNVPSFGQLYQPSHGSIDQVRGNPDLEEEKVWTVSAGISHRMDEDRTAQLTFFREETDGKIVHLEGADRIKRPVNIDGAYRQGVEMTIDWQLVPTAGLDLSLLLQHSRNRENGKTLTYAPAHKIKMALDWAFPTKTRTQTTVTHTGSQFSDLENTPAKTIQVYTTVDVKLIQPVRLGAYPAECYLFFQNLLDEGYQVHYGYPDDGLRVSVGMNLDF